MSSFVGHYVLPWHHNALHSSTPGPQAQSVDGPCPQEADGQFGPVVDACRSQFDFTLLFEEWILTITPSIIFILCAIARIAVLHPRRTALRPGWLRTAKLTAATISLALRAAILAEQCVGTQLRTSASVPSAALALVATCTAAILSLYEHQKAKQPSSLLLAYLFVTALFEAVKSRTYWRIPEQTTAGITIANCLVIVLFFGLEATNKAHLLVDYSNPFSKEELSGPISKSFFLWLNGLFRRGYAHSFVPEDLAPIDRLLYSESICNSFRPLFSTHKVPSVMGFGRVILGCVAIPALTPILPRLALTAFTYSQSLLADAMLKYLSDTSPMSNGYGLIGACVFVYVGIAVATSWYWRQVFRLMTVLRGGLVVAIFEKVVRLGEDSEVESKATTMMISDVQRIVSGVEYFYEVGAGIIETGLATYLLYRMVGVSCFTILGLALVMGASCMWASKSITVQQQVWLKAMEARIGATKRLLDSLKAVKMSGGENKVSKTVRDLRAKEIRAARMFRILITLSVVLSYAMMTLAPLLVFGTYIGISGVRHATLDASTMFSSLVVISLVGSALIHVFQALPAIGSAYGCLKRLHAFIYLVEPDRGVSYDPEQHAENISRPPPGTEKLALEVKDASFGWSSDKPILHRVNLNISVGSQVAIVGSTGSGKSLLMKSLVGESDPTQATPWVPLDKTAYCGQTPWLENVSAEEVWTQRAFFLEDPKVRDEIQDCCALDDILAMTDYRTGSIGSGGVRLSGGQRQRLTLARAIAAKKEIVLLDDAFSAMDRATREHVSTRLLGPEGLLRRRGSTVIYTTHDKRIAGLADEIYEIDGDGNLELATAWHVEKGDSSSSGTGADEDGDPTGDEKSEPVQQLDEESTAQDRLGSKTRSHLPPSGGASSKESKQPASSTTIADRAVYKRYMRAMGLFNAGIFLVLGVVFAFTFKFPQLWLEWWSTAIAKGDPHGNGYWLGIFSMLQILPLITLAVWVLHLMLGIVPASATDLHSALLQTTLFAPFAYISRVDTGELLNRFNQDLMFVDGFLPINLFNTCAELFSSVFQMILIAIVSKEALAVLPALAVALYLIQRVYLRTSKQLRHMDLEWKGALHTKFGETCSGLVTLRANGWVDTMRVKFREKLDRSQEPFYLLYMVQRWLQLVLGLVVAALAVAIAGVAVSLRDKVVAGAVGVAFLNVTTLGSSLTNFIIAWTSLETSLGAISRIALFERDTPDERRDRGRGTTSVDAKWPQRGHVRFENTHTGYATDLETNSVNWTLRGVTFDIPPGQRVAVCGRTGSGKSTLLLALLGLLDVPEGRIIVDGVDISTIEAGALRQRLTTISQDCFMDSSTFREELDPEKHYSDETMIATLAELGIWDKMKECGGLDAKRIDSNLSSGEGQLVSIARLILGAAISASSVIILDEATSSLDHESAIKAERMVAKRLQGKTIISVLHRPELAVEYDEIVVLDKGTLVDIGPAADVIGRCDLFASHRK